MNCTKVKYDSRKAATKALHYQQKWGAQVKRVYFCSKCNGYHLTSSRHSWDNDGMYNTMQKNKGKKRKRSRELQYEEW